MRDSLQDVYVEQLQDLYNAEQQILKALPKMAQNARHSELQTAFKDHEAATRVHVERLERIFKDLGQKPGGTKCKGMEGLLEEGEETMQKFQDGDALDAAMIASAQRVEHYEMAGYGAVRSFASMLGFDDQADLLQETLNEEGDTDKKLSDLAETVINLDAIEGQAD